MLKIRLDWPGGNERIRLCFDFPRDHDLLPISRPKVLSRGSPKLPTNERGMIGKRKVAAGMVVERQAMGARVVTFVNQ